MSVPILAGLRCRCPECGRGRILKKFLEVDRCDNCGLDLREANPGDGLATIVFLLVGGLGCLGIVWSERTFNPPIWVLMAIWLPVIGVLSIVLLWPFKGLTIALLYRTQAKEAVAEWRRQQGGDAAPDRAAAAPDVDHPA